MGCVKSQRLSSQTQSSTNTTPPPWISGTLEMSSLFLVKVNGHGKDKGEGRSEKENTFHL
jgi:hypothetical protein